MKNTIKRITSRMRLPSARQEEEPAGRNITPPSAANADDPHTTPPDQTIPSEQVDTPAEIQIKTPETFLPANPSSSKPKSSLVTKIFGSSNKKEETHPALLEQGITGADFNQPLFDGTSTDPHDHLIDIDTPSMETCPDVRVYFYLIGEVFDDLAGIERPKDHEGRIKHDARVVRAGREYLKYCRPLGAGYWLSSHHDILAKNVPGHDYYRLPTIGVINDYHNHDGDVMEGDGFHYDGAECLQFEDGDGSKFENGFMEQTGLLLTNIRVPILWAESYRPGVVPGTVGWDKSIGIIYKMNEHPAFVLTQMGEEDDWDRVILSIMCCCTRGYVSPQEPCLWSIAEPVMRRDWPNLRRPWRRGEDNFQGPGILEYSGHTVDEFLGRTQPST